MKFTRKSVPRIAVVVGSVAGVGMIASTSASRSESTPTTPLVAFAANDLGMHCMQQDFQDLMILPPFNTLHVQVIDRSGHEPHIIEERLDIRYKIPGNTTAANKTNFWTYDQDLLGVDCPPDGGLTGNGLSGTLVRNDGDNDWIASGIPLTPIDDDNRENPYPLATVKVYENGTLKAETQTVVPVSWEINCSLCHNDPEVTTGQDILMDHDNLHGTDLMNNRPIFCASCHADPVLGAPGDPNLDSFSSVMHTAHASRMDAVNLEESCYACHPGVRTQCQRDIHFANGITCTDCHGDMTQVGNPNRTPWVDEPRCENCHSRSGFDFEQPGKLFRESKGHGGVHCYACHGSPHAITPTVTETDNVQAVLLQGQAGIINDCSVCHSQPPEDSFFHSRDD